MKELLKATALTKVYRTGEVEVRALQEVDLSVSEGEFIVILGPSGSGKSTLLNILGGIDGASEGSLLFDGENLAAANERALTRYRRHAVGFVFQFYNLMPNLTARENVKLAADISVAPLNVDEALKNVDMADRAGHFPSQLSGGEQQRVAIARAVVKNPRLLLCDEPTGALDVKTGVQVLKVLRNFNRLYGKTVMVITHNASIADMADRVLYMRDGRVIRETVNAQPVEAEQVAW
jgi:putative ABC transport system ATP-binding protein